MSLIDSPAAHARGATKCESGIGTFGMPGESGLRTAKRLWKRIAASVWIGPKTGMQTDGTPGPVIAEGMVFTLRGTTFRVTQVIADANVVYLEPQRRDGVWAGFDRAGDLAGLKEALAAAHAASLSAHNTT